MPAATEQRFQQSRHGFTKLAAIFRDTDGWRRIRTGEVPTAIVSRVYGLDSFAAVSSNEIDDIEGIIPGGRYGPDSNGNLQIGLTPAYAVGATTRSLFINLAGQSQSGTGVSAVNLAPYQLRSEKDVPGGYAGLDAFGRILASEIPLPTNATLVYNSDGTLASLTDANGSKAFGYTSGKLTMITGTGIYPSKSFGYSGDQLTSITVI